MTTYPYMITYTCEGGTRMERVALELAGPLRTVDDVAGLERNLRRAIDEPDAFIVAFSPFAGPAERSGGGQR